MCDQSDDQYLIQPQPKSIGPLRSTLQLDVCDFELAHQQILAETQVSVTVSVSVYLSKEGPSEGWLSILKTCVA